MTKVLIVEDEAISALLIQKKLAAAGLDVLPPVATGEKAVELALNEKPDIVFMDIRLAGRMDGIEAAGRIRAVLPVRLIFMSGYHDGDFRERALAMNPYMYLDKPVVFESLPGLCISTDAAPGRTLSAPEHSV